MYAPHRRIFDIATMAGVGLTTLLFLTGCPQAQQPTGGDTSTTTTSPAEPDGRNDPDRIERPITPPQADNGGLTGSGDGNGHSGNPGSGGGPGGTPDPTPPTGSIAVSVFDPALTQRLRPGPLVDVRFQVVDPSGVVTATELVLFRDDNGDGEPDGDAVMTQSIAAGSTSFSLDTTAAAGLLNNGFGQFVVGIRAKRTSGAPVVATATGKIILDSVPPSAAWITPDSDNLVNRGSSVALQVRTSDTSPHSVRALLDPDTQPLSGNEVELLPATPLAAGTAVRSFTAPLSAPAGTYNYYVLASDGVAPATGFYAADAVSGRRWQIALTNRLIGTFDLNQLANSNQGGVLQGFNFNDLAGSSITRVPDMTNDGIDELLIASRFGKPYIINGAGVGFGEAYLIYGGGQRLRGIRPLNAVGHGNISGLAIAGIRCPLNTTWTQGLADVAVVDDMDGDDLPELVFAFPRVESVSLGNVFRDIQHPELTPDVGGLGELEYDAYHDDGPGTPLRWHKNEAQFTRGGVVIVSSSTVTLTDSGAFNRKGNRVLDLHEVGQNFNNKNGIDIFTPLIRSIREANGPQMTMCGDPPQPLEYEDWTIKWDVTFDHQGPGGFWNQFTGPPWYYLPAELPFNPPLAGNVTLGLTIPGFIDDAVPPITDPCLPEHCIRHNEWHVYPFLPATVSTNTPAWHTTGGATGGESQISVWTGFYGRSGVDASPMDDSVGARVLGQRREDQFGASLGSDGTWLYVTAPQRSALKFRDVPLLEDDRAGSGVVYQLRTDNRLSPGSPTLTQLWIENGTREIPAPNPNDPPTTVALAWPNCDAQLPDREDWTMPVPHQYIIEDIGYLRGRDLWWNGAMGDADVGDRIVTYETQVPCNGPTVTREGGVLANAPADSPLYPVYSVGTAAYYVDRTPQIVGPHVNARISFVKGLGDLNGDGIRDFAVGSANVQQDFTDPQHPTGPTVGGLFIVYGRTPGLEGDYLLDRLGLNIGDPNRINGVLVKGSGAGETLARVLADAGDVNGDGFADVLIGNEGADGGKGEAILLFGSSTLLSPGPGDEGGTVGGGWTPATIPSERGVRIRGAAAGDLAGANVASAGDVDHDGLADILIAAPGADGGRGAVYLLYGSRHPASVINLGDLSPRNVSTHYVKFTGRNATDFLGGGVKTVTGTDGNGGSTTAYSQGLAPLGDIDGDGNADFAISAMLADSGGKTDAGEVYVLYGRTGP